jgi:hypothetical protein
MSIEVVVALVVWLAANVALVSLSVYAQRRDRQRTRVRDLSTIGQQRRLVRRGVKR